MRLSRLSVGQVLGTTAGSLRLVALGLACCSLASAVRSIRAAMVAIRDESATYDLTSAVIGWPAVSFTFVAPVLAAAVALNLSPERAGLLYESAILAEIAAAALMLTDVVRRTLTMCVDRPVA